VRNAQPRADQSSSPAAQPRAGAAAQPAKPASPEDDELESALLEFDPTSTDVSAVFVQAQTVSGEPSGTFETIILSSEDAESEESSREQSGRELAETDEVEAAFEFELDDATALEPPPPARPPTARSAGPARESEPPSLEAPEDSEADAVAAAQLEPPVRAITGSQRLSGAMGALFGADSAPGVPPWASANRVLLGLCAALAVLLGIQVLHHFRSDLAEGSFLSRPLAAVYGALGMPITPRWDVSAYEVRQLGAFAGPKGSNALTVRASIKNTGQRAQPLPLLRITVQDRFGNRVAARDVPPSAYRVGAQRDLAPGQRVDAEIAFVDPGANVVGFDIDACLLEGASRIVCSNDLSALR